LPIDDVVGEFWTSDVILREGTDGSNFSSSVSCSLLRIGCWEFSILTGGFSNVSFVEFDRLGFLFLVEGFLVLPFNIAEGHGSSITMID
jgi:hypothetical protein